MKGWRVSRRSSSHGVKDRNIERDEDLVLFRELHQRDKDRIVSLLLPVSDEFEPNVPDRKPGNYELYRIPSAKKGSSGFEFLTHENDKHDTDWLKTPPATPLFPSLEMEATGPQLVNININQKHSTPNPIPALQQPPLSRFAAASPEAPPPSKPKSSNGVTKSPNYQQPKKSPLRSTTPSQSQSQSQSRPTTNITSSTTTQTNKPTRSSGRGRSTPPDSDYTNINNNAKKSISNTTHEKERQWEFLASNLVSKNATTDIPKTNYKPRSRAVSPLVIRSTIPAQIPEFSNETPPNLITDDERSISATRGRPPAPARRQSCSPSVTRGRKLVVEPITAKHDRVQVLGSRMVEKVMNARKANSAAATHHELLKDTRPKSRGSMTDQTSAPSPTTGRMMISNNIIAKPCPPTLWSHSRRS